jgi:hypothetical protein
MPTNFWMFFVTAFIPLLIGSIWYNPKVFGTAWMRINGFKEEDLQGANMALIFGLCFVFGVLISAALSTMVIHQGGVMQMMMPAAAESGSAAQQQFNDLMTQYGTAHRSFGHGALHGGILVPLLILPIIAINALFERRGWKYILIHSGYWFVCLALMGGVLCKYLQYGSLS